jgi:hypothetical protein
MRPGLTRWPLSHVDLPAARRARQEAEDRAAAAEAAARGAADAARADCARAARAARTEAREASSAAEGRMREYMERFREQVGGLKGRASLVERHSALALERERPAPAPFLPRRLSRPARPPTLPSPGHSPPLSRSPLQVRLRDEELAALTALHTSTKATADKRIAELEARSARLADANRALELRRALDADGWAADVALLRKQLAAVERKLTQMKLIDRWLAGGGAREGAGAEHARRLDSHD